MRMTLFLIAGCVCLFAGGALHAQERDSSATVTRQLPAPPKVKSKGTTSPTAPARTVQRDSTPKPIAPRKSKSAPAARPEKRLPRVEKPAKPRA